MTVCTLRKLLRRTYQENNTTRRTTVDFQSQPLPFQTDRITPVDSSTRQKRRDG
ncbi:hypothetical protein [uncultured Bacteroides sp.]|uniref:hypothetical protein n=1 Tax=uncultured Bacteroides sp. TaxID=162156 RepID=UPI0025DFDCA7|nr:hypothetical protein [uncultured Bacteroides sp.]